LITNDWNLNVSNGYDIMAMLLTYCNENFNFKDILKCISRLANHHIFLRKLTQSKSFMD